MLSWRHVTLLYVVRHAHDDMLLAVLLCHYFLYLGAFRDQLRPSSLIQILRLSQPLIRC